jgi:hypothetical protein
MIYVLYAVSKEGKGLVVESRGRGREAAIERDCEHGV